MLGLETVEKKKGFLQDAKRVARRSFFFFGKKPSIGILMSGIEKMGLGRNNVQAECTGIAEAYRLHYDDLIEQLAVLIEARYPERQEDAIKDRLYKAYTHSNKDIDFIIDFIENAPDEDDYWNN